MANDIKKTKIIETESNGFQRTNPYSAGIDVGAGSMYVCAGFEDGRQAVRKFLTFTADIRAAAAWLKQCNIKSVAMESTGSYWIPIYDILEEEGFEVYLVNAHHIKAINGQKTDVKDSKWIQKLHAHGFLRGSFRPDSHGVTFRTYVRQRSRLIELSSVQIQLMNKAMIQMNIRLDQVFSEISGVSSMEIIRSIVAGERNPAILAKHRRTQCKKNEQDVIKALEGNFRPEHIFALEQALRVYDCIKGLVSECDAKIKEILDNWYVSQQEPLLPVNLERPSDASDTKQNEASYKKKKKNAGKNAYNFDAALLLKRILGVDLTEICGIDANTAIKIMSEIGTDMSCWKTVGHFVSWLGLCPNNKISGDAVLSSRTMPTNNRASQAFRMAANSLHHSKSALGAFFRRMRTKLGTPSAIVATGHKLAKIVYVMIREKKSFHDIGQDAYEQQFQKRRLDNLRRAAKEMGFDLQPI